jgi:S1-C subfamily serine protease
MPATPALPARKARRIGTGALLALAVAGGAVGGGAVGSVAATRLAPRQAAASTITSAQPVAIQSAPAQSVAGSVFSKVNPAVVEVVVSGQMAGGPMSYGNGSGFVVDARGLILTNNHVVEDARAISVRFSTGEEREAQVLGTDAGNDLAVIKVDLPANTPVAAMGDSDRVAPGETAIAIGSPFGLEQTITQGIISAVHRDWAPGNGRTQRNLLQTDAPINPGNSGGPLLNANGEVIGINSMIESPVRASVGVGFAIPINTAKRLIPQLEAGAHNEPAWLGISGAELDATIAKDQGLSVQQGVLVTGIVPGGPAAGAGLRGGQGQNERIPRGGDVITAVDGKAVKNMSELADQVAGHKPGDKVTLTIMRDGKQQQLTVTLEAWPADQG